MNSPIFITGNSRSGTTMMMRIMNRHSKVHAINEPHFFGSHWSSSDRGQALRKEDAEQLLLKLFTRQRVSFFAKVEQHAHEFMAEAKQIVEDLFAQDKVERADVYKRFLQYETITQGKERPCEKTPQNIFYIKEILTLFPDARIINMVRDPRATMLSQKNKWKRKALGADFMTTKEVRRLRANYHPITMSKLWNAAIGAAEDWKDADAIIDIRFESLREDPERILKEVCAHIRLDFEAEMMDIPQAGSSLQEDDNDSRGIRRSEKLTWKEKGLLPAELYWCQRICEEGMSAYEYDMVASEAGLGQILTSALTFPLKLALALLYNLDRVRNLSDTVRRRLKR